MSFSEYLNGLLLKYSIPNASALPLSDCRLLREYKLKSHFESTDGLYVCMITVPYYVSGEKSNISEYAKARDYHAFFDMLWGDILPALREKYPTYTFCGFSDNSPIDERDAAARAGLGVLGQNGLLITKKYSSYVFLGEIITDLPLPEAISRDIEHCTGCGACTRACPKAAYGICLSELTQKKGVLSENEKNIIKKYGSAWGCDICSEVCPYTHNAIKSKTIYTEVEFFKSHRYEQLSEDTVRNMSDGEFSMRAYSWRKKETILRNLKALEES